MPIRIQGHRGYSGKYPENTLLAFDAAVKAGATQVELDIQAAKDGTVYVLHDAKVDRTTNGFGFIHDMLPEQIRLLDAGIWKGAAFAGEPVPTLADALRLLQGRATVNIEIKLNGAPLAAARAAVAGSLEIIEQLDMFDQVFFSSFHLDALYWAKRTDRRVRIGLLDWDRETFLDRQLSVTAMEGDVWLTLPELATKQRVDEAHQRGLIVIAGGGNNPSTREQSVVNLVTVGVDYISTNFPAEVKDVLDKKALPYSTVP